jgi:uncharacterized protein (TIGR00255 family)
MKSMTGFGRGEASANGITCSVEMASVNRKQLEVSVNLPRELADLEPTLRNEVATRASRGRVQVSVKLDTSAGEVSRLSVDSALAAEYLKAARELAASLHLPDEITLRDVLRWPGVTDLSRTELDLEAITPLVTSATSQALTQLIATREAEGTALKLDLEQRLQKVQDLLEQITSVSSGVVEHHRKALHQRLAEAGLVVDLNDERLVKELVLYSDRCDISEEITRARSHVLQFQNYLSGDQAVGRPLDFLMQEFGREFNTMGSKANHAALAHLVVEAKTEIEKIREQVQNIE